MPAHRGQGPSPINDPSRLTLLEGAQAKVLATIKVSLMTEAPVAPMQSPKLGMAQTVADVADVAEQHRSTFKQG
jgi:hypothetical protein